jgi:hypothetical protein
VGQQKTSVDGLTTPAWLKLSTRQSGFPNYANYLCEQAAVRIRRTNRRNPGRAGSGLVGFHGRGRRPGCPDLSAPFPKSSTNEPKSCHRWRKKPKIYPSYCTLALHRIRSSRRKILASHQPSRSHRLDSVCSDDHVQLERSWHHTKRCLARTLPSEKVRERFLRLNSKGIAGLGDRPGNGHKPGSPYPDVTGPSRW